MDLFKWKEKIKSNPRNKQRFLNLIMHPVKARSRLWLRLLQFLYIKKGKGAIIYNSVRKDLVPFNHFALGDYSVVEDFSVLNNAVGDVIIGNKSRVGLGNTIIGPVSIGNHVNLAQNVVLSGLNHKYENVELPIDMQGVSKVRIIIEDDVWIGANSVIVAGVTIGTHSCVGGGSVVTKSVPPYSVVAGNPARVIKQYDFDKKEWVRV